MLSTMLGMALAGSPTSLRNTMLALPTNPRSVPMHTYGASSQVVLRREASMAARLEAEEHRVQKLTAVLEYLGYSEPLGDEAEFITGHLPAFEVYKTPDWRVRVEGENTPPGNSLEVSMYG